MPKQQPGNRKQQRYEPLAVLAYIADYAQHSPRRSPSERRIQKDLGISAPSVVHEILGRLEQAGLLIITRYGRGQLSDLTLTEAGQTAAQMWQEAQAADNDTSADQD